MSVGIGTVFRNRYSVTGKLGQGAFGEIYAATCLYTRDRVAIKLEKHSNTSKGVLKLEVAILKKLQGNPFIAKYYTCGRADEYNFVVMELLGDNLSELRKRQVSGCFSIPTIAQLAIQMSSAIEILHSHGYIHRDIKPSNFAIGSRPSTSGHLYIIDFGLSRRFREPDGSIRPARKSAGFRGTARYASLTSHFSDDLSRKDDFWSLFYVLIELAVGSLPWKRLRDRDAISTMKQKFPIQRLINGLPSGFAEFADHLQSLSYASRPNYRLIHKIFHLMLATQMHKENLRSPPALDWQTPLATNPPYLLYPPKQILDVVKDDELDDFHCSTRYLRRKSAQPLLNLEEEIGQRNSDRSDSSSLKARSTSSPTKDDPNSVELMRSPSGVQRNSRNSRNIAHWSQADLSGISPRGRLFVPEEVSEEEEEEKEKANEIEKADFCEIKHLIDEIVLEEGDESERSERAEKSEDHDVSISQLIGHTLKDSPSLLELQGGEVNKDQFKIGQKGSESSRKSSPIRNDRSSLRQQSSLSSSFCCNIL
ncbi:hypothetical protein P9112_008392 [Eukaryota sp. TZLM1-RC]